MSKIASYILMVMIFTLSCTNNHNHSFIEFKHSFSQWNLIYSPTSSFITVNDLLLYQKKFIGEEYINDIKRFLIELNQINPKRLDKENNLEYQSIKIFLEYNIFVNETLNFDEWNALYLLNNYYHHLSYIGKLVQNKYTARAPSLNLDFLISEIKFFNDQIFFLMKNLKYKHNAEPELIVVSSLIEKMINYSDHIVHYALENQLVTTLHRDIKSLRRTMYQLRDWHENQYHKLKPFQNKISDINYKKYFYLNSDFRIEFFDILNNTKTALAKHKKILFELSLPLYLKNNDEPVWTDFSDTVNVINTVLDTLENVEYKCSDKDAAIRIIDSSIYELFNDNLYKNKDIIFIYHNQEVENDFNYYNTKGINEIYVNTSKSSDNLFQNYYFTLMNLLPGDLFIYNRLKENDGFNSIYLNRDYFYGFKLFLINYYLKNSTRQSDDSKLCGLKNSEYLTVMKLFYLKDRIIDCIGTIATINYYLEKKDISDSIQLHDQLNLINDKKNNLLKEEIFGYKMDSIIKFISINKFQDLLQNGNRADELKLLNILYENPNMNLITIEKLFNK